MFRKKVEPGVRNPDREGFSGVDPRRALHGPEEGGAAAARSPGQGDLHSRPPTREYPGFVAVVAVHHHPEILGDAPVVAIEGVRLGGGDTGSGASSRTITFSGRAEASSTLILPLLSISRIFMPASFTGGPSFRSKKPQLYALPSGAHMDIQAP